MIQNDDHQRSIVALLQTMYDQLESYTPLPVPTPLAPPASHSLFAKLFSAAPHRLVPKISTDVPKGLYLYGSVGCGKSFLMDLFYANLPSRFDSSKRRIHFHAFMMDVHQRGHRMKVELGDQGDWIVPIARELAREARVLCFDEFQVTDIADAMILRRLMESLMGYGVVAVMTSNRHPDELYKNGIQREQFIPCIELIKDRFVVKCLDSDIGTRSSILHSSLTVLDYRKLPRALSKVYFSPITPEHVSEVDKLFEALTSDEPVIAHRQLSVWGRHLDVPMSSTKVARFTFKQLCEASLSAADYIEICKNFETVFITDVPQLDLSVKDQARRFILFIDSAYEAKVRRLLSSRVSDATQTKLFILSDPPINSVFSDDGAAASGEISDHQRGVMDDLGLKADDVGVSSMFTGEEEVFAFARAVVRPSLSLLQAHTRTVTNHGDGERAVGAGRAERESGGESAERPSAAAVSRWSIEQCTQLHRITTRRLSRSWPATARGGTAARRLDDLPPSKGCTSSRRSSATHRQREGDGTRVRTESRTSTWIPRPFKYFLNEGGGNNPRGPVPTRRISARSVSADQTSDRTDLVSV